MQDGLVSLRIDGFASLADVELRPGPLTVLIGANGSGKSNVLKALQLVLHLRTGALQRFVGEAGGAASILHYGPKRTPQLSLQLDFVQGGQRNRYAARLGYAAGDRLLFLEESVGFAGGGDAATKRTALGTGHWESALDAAAPADATARTVRFLLSKLTYFHFHDTSPASALRTHARPEDDRYLRSDGSNLAAYLARLQSSADRADQTAWLRINQLVRRIAPAVRELAPTVGSGPNGGVRLDWVDDRGERFGVHHLSDGTLRAIALVTALGQPAERLPRFIAIDEPELGLHPVAIQLVAALARSVSHHAQVLFATQSTAFLDHFEPEEVVVVERRGGATQLLRPDPRALRVWLDDYSVSEVFEKGLLGGLP